MSQYDNTYYQRLVGKSVFTGRDYRILLVKGLSLLLSRLVKAHDIVVDIGCGDGFFVRELAGIYRTIGADISQSGLKISKSIHAGCVMQADIHAIPFANASCHCVLALDVLEHVISPINALKEVIRILQPGGYVIISTPNAKSLGSRTKGKNWFANLDVTHVSIHSVQTWRTLIKSTGLSIVRDGTDFPWDTPYPLPVPNKLQRLAAAGLNTIIRSTLIFLSWESGENYYAVCRKEFR